MQGNVVTAAKWLGVTILLGSIVMVLGIHLAFSIHTARIEEAIRQTTSQDKRHSQKHPGQESVSTLETPDARVKQLFQETEDIKQLTTDWERFWFSDQPSHRTHERVHGGIM